jgi:hypothetical protein
MPYAVRAASIFEGNIFFGQVNIVLKCASVDLSAQSGKCVVAEFGADEDVRVNCAESPGHLISIGIYKIIIALFWIGFQVSTSWRLGACGQSSLF